MNQVTAIIARANKANLTTEQTGTAIALCTGICISQADVSEAMTATQGKEAKEYTMQCITQAGKILQR